MTLRLFNTLTRRVEAFEPLAPPRVTMYTCGPTIWNYAHIGNYRTFMFQDLLRRYLKYLGYDVFQIMNLTDVDDRTIKEAAKAELSLGDYTQPYADAFFADRDYLRIEAAEVYPRATESIPEMVSLIEQLLAKGVAYKAEDGSVYYGVERFETYGRLSQIERRELKAGARVDSDEYSKEDARDFALWKAAEPDDEKVGAAWDAPFGRGRPGWHLECSAMALNQLKERFGISTLDIHAGGVDLIFPHHENEIAQSEAVTGEPFSRCWVHGEFLTLGGTKMSKRFGNILTARDLMEEGVDPAAVRMFLFQTHYRRQLSFSDEGLVAAGKGAERIGEARSRLVLASQNARPEAGTQNQAAHALELAFREALDDDLNAPEAVGAVSQFVTAANRALDKNEWSAEEAAHGLGVLDSIMAVLDLIPGNRSLDAGLADWVEERLLARREARKQRKFDEADAIRDELLARGVVLEDTPDGTRWRLQSG